MPIQDEVRVRHNVTGCESVLPRPALPYWQGLGWEPIDDDADDAAEPSDAVEPAAATKPAQPARKSTAKSEKKG